MRRRQWGALAVLALGLLAPCLLSPHLLSPEAHVLEIIMMTVLAWSKEVQINGCKVIAGQGFAVAYPPYFQTGAPAQALMAGAGAIGAVFSAMHRFPDDRAVQHACANALGGLTLWSYPNGLRVGNEGGLELLMRNYKKWPMEPAMLRFADLGCFFDFVPENRQRFRDLGGVEMLRDFLRMHYWDGSVNLNVWYAFASGAYDNGDKLRDAELLELGVRSMRDHAGVPRVREEVLQAFKAAAVHSAEIRELLAAAGAPEQYIRAVNESARDPQLTSLVCENTMIMVGGDVSVWSVRGKEETPAFNATHQRSFTDVGAVEAFFEIIKTEQMMALRKNAAGYNVLKDCLQALATLVFEYPEKQKALVELGAVEVVAEAAKRGVQDHLDSVPANSCKLLKELALVDAARVKAAGPHPECIVE